jgi:hypothetical protein
MDWNRTETEILADIDTGILCQYGEIPRQNGSLSANIYPLLATSALTTTPTTTGSGTTNTGLPKSDASRLHTREILTSFSLCILAISCTL